MGFLQRIAPLIFFVAVIFAVSGPWAAFGGQAASTKAVPGTTAQNSNVNDAMIQYSLANIRVTKFVCKDPIPAFVCRIINNILSSHK